MAKTIKIGYTKYCDQNILDIIAYNIKYYRKEQDITQETLAANANIEAKMLSSYENAKVNLSISSVTNIAAALKVSLFDILTDRRPVEK